MSKSLTDINTAASDSFISTDPKSAAASRVGAEEDKIFAPLETVKNGVIYNQQTFIAAWLLQNVKDEELKVRLNGYQDSKEIARHFNDPAIKQQIQKAYQDKDFRAQLGVVESESYKALHSQLKDTLKPINWEAPDSENIRSVKISNQNGLALTLKEKNHTRPVTVQLDDGSSQTLNNYRTIDFPTNLEANKGPLHMSLVVKDPDGKSINADKAVFFTADYDKEGKLVEVTSPLPVKFAGIGDEAIGYVERDGQIYTLAVNQGQYKTMMQEVAKNHGLSANLSQMAEAGVPAPAPSVNLAAAQAKEQEKQPAKSYLGMEHFEVATAKSKGGVTGSKRVTGTDGKFYQLKNSIKDAPYIRKFKAGGADHENYGELIASAISGSLVGSEAGVKLVPEISLIYDQAKKKTLIASRYLENVQGTLDGYARKKRGVEQDKKHIIVNFNKQSNDKNLLGLGAEGDKLLRKDLSTALALSALSGDHDINPGNMIVFKAAGKDRIARIDFGHAFNDLLNAPQSLGGRIRNSDNKILDYLNREEIAHLQPGHRTSKLWRNYEGVIPSQELADAMKELASTNKLPEGIKNAKAPFESLINDLEKSPTENKDVLEHIKKSMLAINDNMSGSKIDPKLSPQEVLTHTFTNIEKFYNENARQMQQVSTLLQMQVNIDKMLKGKAGVTPDLQLRVEGGLHGAQEKLQNASREEQSLSQEIKSQFAAVQSAKGIGKGDGQIEWVKTTKNIPAFKGSLDDYIKHRGEQLGTGKNIINRIKVSIENSPAADSATSKVPPPDSPSLSEKSKEKSIKEQGAAGEFFLGKTMKEIIKNTGAIEQPSNREERTNTVSGNREERTNTVSGNREERTNTVYGSLPPPDSPSLSEKSKEQAATQPQRERSHREGGGNTKMAPTADKTPSRRNSVASHFPPQLGQQVENIRKELSNSQDKGPNSGQKPRRSLPARDITIGQHR